jgi:predicted short-subunit dehydrogenase-like oxidoreductase (DUF2520 family)
MRVAIVGAGRAGTSFAAALARAGHEVALVHHDALSDDDVAGAELVLLTVPDDALAETAQRLAPDARRVVAHAAGSRTLEVLAPHPRVASLHPLVTLPSPERGAERLARATYAVAGDPAARRLVESLGAVAREVPESERTAYHAAAAIAANHLVALLAHAQRVGEAAGLDGGDLVELARGALDDVARRGAEAALTGPASRGDVATIDAHLAAIPEGERATYVALANAAFELAERRARLATP